MKAHRFETVSMCRRFKWSFFAGAILAVCCTWSAIAQAPIWVRFLQDHILGIPAHE
jgi:hypothetical protein